MPVLLVADSRGHGLKKYLQIRAPNVFEVSSKSGARLKKLFKMARTKLATSTYTAVIIMGGICDITERDQETHITSLRTEDQEEITTNIRKSIKAGKKRIKKVAPNIPIIITPTMGIDLTRYNGFPVDQHTQEVLNSMILEANKMIISCNKEGVPIPWISKMVHHCRGGQRWAHRYQHLRDGCHYTNRLKVFIANEMAKCLSRL